MKHKLFIILMFILISRDIYSQEDITEQKILAIKNVNVITMTLPNKVLSATWLGPDSQVGTIASGKLADLILLEANPLDDVKNTRKISGVVVDGRWLPKEALQAMLADLSRRNTAEKEKYDWKKTIGK